MHLVDTISLMSFERCLIHKLGHYLGLTLMFTRFHCFAFCSSTIMLNAFCSSTIMLNDAAKFVPVCVKNEIQPCDYKELLELSLIYMDRKPFTIVHLLTPSILYQAMCTAKTIYYFKILLFKLQSS